jgi:hypothetical protein
MDCGLLQNKMALAGLHVPSTPLGKPLGLGALGLPHMDFLGAGISQNKRQRPMSLFHG